MGNENSGVKPKNYPMTFEQMTAYNEASKPKKLSRREYIESNKADISMLVGDLASRLEEKETNKDKASLKDTERIKDISLEYIRSCTVTGTLPTITGVALACGYAYRSFRAFMVKNPDHETTKWLYELKDHFAELLNQASLGGDVAPVPAIFTLKANYGWNDQPEIETKNNSEAEELTPDAIAAKYDDLPD